MLDLLHMKLDGQHKNMQRFIQQLENVKVDCKSIVTYKEIVALEMEMLGFDTIAEDSLGTLYGIMRGIESGEDMLVVSHIEDDDVIVENSKPDVPPFNSYKGGLASALYGTGLLKAALLPLKGDLIVCFVSRSVFGLYAIENFYEEIIKPRNSKIKGALLSEPTDFRLHLGHKGRLEYEINVKGQLSGLGTSSSLNMLGSIFPLVHALEKASSGLPSDYTLGNSTLRIKDIKYSNPQDAENNQFSIVVERVFVPEETTSSILERARTIGTSVYNEMGNIDVKTTLAKSNIKESMGRIGAVKEFKPWLMESHAPFVQSNLAVLQENGFSSSLGYWRRIVTEGSYLNGIKKIPTIGFGAGNEQTIIPSTKQRDWERAALGIALLVHRSVGIQSFGWCTDEI
ncbi:MAG: hypothetical protein JNL74_09420 [Fibrobacteres bacterium]|nr:hypothetical protein [Fibrobacterota bacterium]